MNIKALVMNTLETFWKSSVYTRQTYKHQSNFLQHPVSNDTTVKIKLICTPTPNIYSYKLAIDQIFTEGFEGWFPVPIAELRTNDSRTSMIQN